MRLGSGQVEVTFWKVLRGLCSGMSGRRMAERVSRQDKLVWNLEVI